MSSTHQGQPLIIVTGADDNFAMGVAVTLYSALANLGSDRKVALYIVDDGISERNKRKIAEVLKIGQAIVHFEWLNPNLAVLDNVATTEWHSRATYLRLLLPSLLPEHMDRAIYLDSDLVIEGDLGHLWDEDVDDYAALGVQDYSFPYAYSRTELYPVYQKLHLDRNTPYVNAGVLVINLTWWRREKLAPRVLEFVHQFKNEATFLEQDGLNAIIAGRWGLLDPRWNINLYNLNIYGHLFDMSVAAMQQARADFMRRPLILHYTGQHKPWHFLYIKPGAPRWFYYLRRSGWFSPVTYAVWSLPRRLVHTLFQAFPRGFLRRLGRLRKSAKNRLANVRA